MSRGIGAGIAAIAVAIVAAVPAQGAITVGSDLQRAPTASTCGGAFGDNDCTVSIAGLSATHDAAGGALVPQAGVLTKWRVRRIAGINEVAVGAALRVVRGNTGAGKSAVISLPATAGTHEFAARLPVQAGDRIGIDMTGLSLVSFVSISVGSSDVADTYDAWTPPLAEGATTAPTSPNVPMTELALNADLEPDADGDGFGDETQDLCPINPATQLACAGGSGAAPQTKITKAPKKKSTKTKATIEFTADPVGSVFECSLDFVAYKSCTSPLKLKKLHKGKHTVLVRAIAFGIPDASPAQAKFTVKKKKKRK